MLPHGVASTEGNDMMPRGSPRGGFQETKVKVSDLVWLIPGSAITGYTEAPTRCLIKCHCPSESNRELSAVQSDRQTVGVRGVGDPR